MNFSEFLNKYNGQQNVGNTTENKGQCVGLVAVWIDALSLPHVWGNAADLFANADEKFFDKILNTPEAIPQAGDIIVWSAKFNGTVGHTGIATGTADMNTLECFEQNDPLKSNCHLKVYKYSYVTGWLRPKTVSVGVDPIILQQSDSFIAICTKLGLPANGGVVLGEIDKLLGYEDMILAKDKQLTDAQAQVTSLEKDNQVKATQLQDLQTQVKNLADEVAIAVAENKSDKVTIAQLKKDCNPAPKLKGWKLGLYTWLLKQ